jgi:FMN phosphatase YigB (HAD superfamily)
VSVQRPPGFLYFDLGNVLLFFDHRLASRQMAAVAGVEAELIWEVVYASGLYLRRETCELSDEAYYETICEAIRVRPDPVRLELAGCDIFRRNYTMLPVIAQLKAAGYRLGLLSNTCAAHYEFFGRGRFRMIPEAFDVVVTSFEERVMKPDRKIYEIAAAKAGLPPEEVFFTDDLPVNVEGAQAAGFDAVVYRDTPTLVRDLRARGVLFND